MSKKYAFGIAALSLISANVAAQEMKPIFEIGTEVYQETYKETVNGRDFMQEKATMYGVTGTAGLQLNQQHALKFTGRYAQGKSDYTGAFQGQAYGTLQRNGQDRRTYELRGTYEYTTPMFGQNITPSIGLGYRNLIDKLDQIGAGGYKRESEYTFLALGLESKFVFEGNKLSLTPKFVYNYLLQGTQHSYLTSGTVDNKQKNGNGFELSAAFAYTLQDKSVVKITPFYRYWSISDSERTYVSSTTYFIEPKNKTDEFGINLTYAF